MNDVTKLLDDTGWALLEALQRDGRASWRELGELVGLSAPAVAERVRRLEEAGVIRGYHADVDLALVGRPIRAVVRMSPVDRDLSSALVAHVVELDEVLTCHQVTGTDYFVLDVAVTSVEHLHRLLDDLLHYGQTTSAIVLSSYVEHRVLGAPPG